MPEDKLGHPVNSVNGEGIVYFQVEVPNFSYHGTEVVDIYRVGKSWGSVANFEDLKVA